MLCVGVWHVAQSLVLAGWLKTHPVAGEWQVLQAAARGAAILCIGVWQVPQSVRVGCVMGRQVMPGCEWHSTHVVGA